jgi:Amt family ammonium transporter
MDIAPILLAYLIPIGLVLIAWGSWDHERAQQQAATAILAIALAAIAYAFVGFGFNFGGVGLRPDVPPGLRGLDRMWTPLAGAAGRDWGMFGLKGFLLDASATLPGDVALLYTQFLHHLPIVIAAALVPALTLAGRVRVFVTGLITIVTAGLIVPLLGAWSWGGGWLLSLGHDARFGHGFVDPAGAATVFTAAGFTTLAALIALRVRRNPSRPAAAPTAYLPLRSIFGALLILIGWAAWLTTDPILTALPMIDLALTATNVVLGSAAATVIATLYGWFTTGQPNAHFAARGALSGLIAASAGAAFVPSWGALLLGAGAGLLAPFGTYIVERWLRLDDAAGLVGATALVGLWSIIGVGLLADGTYGAGWHNIGIIEYLGVSGQGVTGLLAAANLENDPGQMSAQLTGAAAILAAAFILGWLAARPLRRLNARVAPDALYSADSTLMTSSSVTWSKRR